MMSVGHAGIAMGVVCGACWDVNVGCVWGMLGYQWRNVYSICE